MYTSVFKSEPNVPCPLDIMSSAAKSVFISALIIWKWKMWMSIAQNREADIDCRPADTNPSIELRGQWETEVETRGSMRMMEPLVVLWPWRGLMGFRNIVWKVGLLMLSKCAVVTWRAFWSVCWHFRRRFPCSICKSWSVPVVPPARPIKFYSFIFHSSAVSSSSSAITLLDGVQLTALWEPKLWADHLLFWCRSPGQSRFNANTLGGVSVGLV